TYDGTSNSTIINQGHWLNSSTYNNDGDYSNTVAPYNSSNPDFKTRHVTMFNDCGRAQKTALGNWHQLYYNTNGDTNRGPFTSVDNLGELSSTKQAPYLVEGAGCTISHTNPNQYMSLFSPNAGTDCRMMFRNYNNSDYTSYGGDGRNPTPNGNGVGIDFRGYDYLEFDLQVDSNIQFTKTRPTGGSVYRVYLYYETNNGSSAYLNRDRCIAGYSDNESSFEFTDQLPFDANGNYQKHGEKVTIRIPLAGLKNASPAPTVKQVTIRMQGGMTITNNAYIKIDDVRLVKNDDHIGKIYTHNGGTGESDPTLYPSGEYFMINDFEYANNATPDKENITQVFTKSSTNPAVPGVDKVLRWEDSQADDTINKIASTSTFSWAYTSGKNSNYTDADSNFFVGGKNIVTQGNYATAISVRDKTTYSGKLGGWHLPTYYERRYDKAMDLSKYTHFAIDVYIRCIDTNVNNGGVKGIKKPTSSQETGVTFAVQLFDTDSLPNSTHDQFSFTKGYTVKFFLPFNKACYQGGKENDPEYGQILPLGTHYGCDRSLNCTDYGAMRFVFTREDLLSALSTIGGATHTLDHINGMRFLWLNRHVYNDTNENDSYDSGETFKNDNYYTYPISDWIPDDNNDALRYDIVLDNFIAYTPDTSITIQNVQNESDNLDGNQQYYLYDIYGGYNATTDGYLTNELGTTILGKTFNGTDDAITTDVNLTVAVPANGNVKINNLPFNSYYISQQNWSWRWQVESIICSNDNDKKKLLKSYVSGSNTATILPRISLNGSYIYNTPIWDIIEQRNFTITFTQKQENNQWLDHNHADITQFSR
ncbi:MAG: hypothetical protein IKM39_00520, partial [Clostridia bacterium]|nr:hypothetical protein [Clostridia bacterium]